MTSALYPYQDKAVTSIATARLPILNAFDPGLGKSRVAIEALIARGHRRVLVLCPHSVVLVWEAEIAKWWSDHPPIVTAPSRMSAGEGVYLVSYGLMSETMGVLAQHLRDTGPFEATIIDEAHFLKNPKSNRSKRVFDLFGEGQLGWVHPMTGTPAPNHAGELWGLLFHLRPDLILSPVTGKPMREGEFQNRYCIVKRFKVNNHWVEQVTGSKNTDDLKARVAPMVVKARKKDVLPELPPIDFVVLPVLATRVPDGIGDVKIFDKYDDDDLLAQLAGGAAKSEIQQLGLAKIPAVLEWIVDLLRDDPDRRLVVWCIHHNVIDRYVGLLQEYQPVKFDGRDNLDQRKLAIERFMSGSARIFVGQIQAGGTGITLVSPTAKCSDVIFAESSFSPSDNYQAACRVHRIGQNDGVLVRHAAASGTLDDRIQEILARKSRDIKEIFG